MFPSAMVDPQVNCKCCNQMAQLYDVCDFSKSCEERSGLVLPLSGIPVYYYKCPNCSFIFTPQFDSGSHEEFKQHIYNDDYVKVDPEYVDKRPKDTARMVESAFGQYKESISILDYGGGSGKVEHLLKAAGFSNVDTYDPFSEQYSKKPKGKYNLVFSVEVVEHVPNVKETFSEMQSFLAEDSMIVFTTLIQPDEIDKVKARWWYISPRNGHISIHSQKSLRIVFNELGLNYVTASQSSHFAFTKIPEFAKHIFRG